tara:strand:- start:940 stop:1230 length:291 start_codon:yes stop_codon:yes gene_type:complete
MLIYVDIDGTICSFTSGKYELAEPNIENINKINELHDKGNHIIYWTARGAVSGDDWTELTTLQLEQWGAKYHELKMNNKPHYDLLICDKTKRIEEI